MAKIIGHGAPTSKTFGVLGQEYFDKDSNKVYTCTKVTHKTAYRAGEADAEYEWTVIGNDPFEVRTEVMEIVPEQSVTSEYSQDTPVGTVCMNRFPKTMDLIDGAKYIVCINNKNYEVTAKEVMGAVVIGDPFLYGAPVDSTGEPFFFMVMHEDPTQYVFVWKAEFGTTVTTSITCEQEIFEKIDYKFMPEGYPSVKTEMVEIVPEQSVTGTLDNDINLYVFNLFDVTGFRHVPFAIYTFKINNTVYDVVSENPMFIGNESLYDGDYTGIPFVYSNGYLGWTKELGETITLEIMWKNEDITMINPKFSHKLFYVSGDPSLDPYIYHDFVREQKASKKDLLSNYNCVLVVIDANFLMYSHPCQIYTGENGEACADVVINNGDNLTLYTYFTSEYTD